ncbi:MAG: hypothetical protein ACKV2U_34195 [Bryobacteraceae bacterium]
MKFPLIVLFFCLASLAQSKESTSVPAGVPDGAVAIEGHTWRWVDKQGKAWLYRATPFGMMRNEEPKQAVAKRPAGLIKTEEPKGGFGPTGQKMADDRPDAVLDLISVKEEGDALRFSRPGPFGTYSWVKKKTQLDRDETIVWERAQAKSAPAKKD